MEQERIDLSPLDPAADELEWRRRVAAVVRAAGPELARRSRRVSPVAAVSEWARPAMAAAAALVLLATAALTMIEREQAPVVVTAGVTEALELPAPAMAWLAEGRPPSVADLVTEIEDGER